MIELYAVVIGKPPKELPHIAPDGKGLAVFEKYAEARFFREQRCLRSDARVVMLREVKP